MRRYWLLSVVLENLKTCWEIKKIGLGRPKRKFVESMTVGDGVTFYVSRTHLDPTNADNKSLQCLMGIAKIAAPMREEKTTIWPPKGSDIYPLRFPIECEIDLSRSVPIKDLFGTLSFIVNESNWGQPLQQGCREITADDFKAIEKKLTAKAPPRS